MKHQPRSTLRAAAMLLGHALASADEAVDHGRALIDFVRSTENGFVHEGIQIRRMDPNDLDSPSGMFIDKDVLKGETLLIIPNAIVIDGERDECKGCVPDNEQDMFCTTIYNVIDEMELGEESELAPYVQYLLDQPHGQLPSSWSDEGFDLLSDMLGVPEYCDDDQPCTQDLPPSEVGGWLEGGWISQCGGDISDPFGIQAAMLVTQRSWDDLMIPLLDMCSHRNGPWQNIESDPVHLGNDIRAFATRDIKAGEQLYLSYNFCTDCSNRLEWYGTAEIFRDYGFVEQYPQRWIFKTDSNILFDLEEEEEDGNDTIRVVWRNSLPLDDSQLEFLDGQLARLEKFNDALWEQKDELPEREWNATSNYRDSLINAMQLAKFSAAAVLAEEEEEKEERLVPEELSQILFPLEQPDVVQCHSVDVNSTSTI